MSRLVKVKLALVDKDHLIATDYIADASGQWERKLLEITSISRSATIERAFERGGFKLTIDDVDGTYKTMMTSDTNRKIANRLVTVYIYKSDGVTIGDTVIASICSWSREDGKFIIECVQEFAGRLGSLHGTKVIFPGDWPNAPEESLWKPILYPTGVLHTNTGAMKLWRVDNSPKTKFLITWSDPTGPMQILSIEDVYEQGALVPLLSGSGWVWSSVDSGETWHSGTPGTGWTWDGSKWSHAVGGGDNQLYGYSDPKSVPGQKYKVEIYVNHVSGDHVSIYLGHTLLGNVSSTGLVVYTNVLPLDQYDLGFIPTTNWVGNITIASEKKWTGSTWGPELVSAPGGVPMAGWGNVPREEHKVWNLKWTHAAGSGNLALNAIADFPVIAGEKYKIDIYVEHVSGTGVSVYIGGTLAGVINTTGQHEILDVVASDTTPLRLVPAVDWVGSIWQAWFPTTGLPMYVSVKQWVSGAWGDELVGSGMSSIWPMQNWANEAIYEKYHLLRDADGWEYLAMNSDYQDSLNVFVNLTAAAADNPVVYLRNKLTQVSAVLVDDGDGGTADFETVCNTYLWYVAELLNITAVKDFIEIWCNNFDCFWYIDSAGAIHIKHIDWASVTVAATLTERHFITFGEKSSGMIDFANRIRAKLDYDYGNSKWLTETVYDSTTGDILPAVTPVEKVEEYAIGLFGGTVKPMTDKLRYVDRPAQIVSAVMDYDLYEMLALRVLSIVSIEHYLQIGGSGKYLILSESKDSVAGAVTLSAFRLWGA